MSKIARQSVQKKRTKQEVPVSREPGPALCQSPSAGSPKDRILYLQRTIGNRVVTHLIQSGAIQASLKSGQPDDIYEQEADRVADQVMRMSSPTELTSVVQQDSPLVSPAFAGPVPGLRISTGAQGLVQRKPADVTAYNFLDIAVQGGVNSTMRTQLNAVAAQLRTRYNTVNGRAPANDREVREWAGVQTMQGWRSDSASSTSKHCSGSAVDVNYSSQPYIVTRTTTGSTTVYGGERAGAGLTAQRQATVEVFDRAMEFVYGGRSADVSARRGGETTTSVYRRFRNVSDALAIYLGLAFHTNYREVRRRPIANIETATERQLLDGIPETERKDEATGTRDIREYILNHAWDANAPDDTYHWNWEDSFLARDYYFRMLRDYEHVRIPFVIGNPEARPPHTRSPARGFLHMTEEFVVAMCDIGNLHWGISDLGTAESGDTHHFDLGNHGGVTPDCTP